MPLGHRQREAQKHGKSLLSSLIASLWKVEIQVRLRREDHPSQTIKVRTILLEAELDMGDGTVANVLENPPDVLDANLGSSRLRCVQGVPDACAPTSERLEAGALGRRDDVDVPIALSRRFDGLCGAAPKHEAGRLLHARSRTGCWLEFADELVPVDLKPDSALGAARCYGFLLLFHDLTSKDCN